MNFRFLIFDFRFSLTGNMCAGLRGDGPGRPRRFNQKSKIKNLKSKRGVCL
jgi:hypothetical protein